MSLYYKYDICNRGTSWGLYIMYIVLYSIILYHIVLYCIVSYGIVWYCMILYGIVLYCIVLFKHRCSSCTKCKWSLKTDFTVYNYHAK